MHCPSHAQNKSLSNKWSLLRRRGSRRSAFAFRARQIRRYPMNAETTVLQPPIPARKAELAENRERRLSYSIHEAADLLGVDYFSVYRLIQRGKLRACLLCEANSSCHAQSF